MTDRERLTARVVDAMARALAEADGLTFDAARRPNQAEAYAVRAEAALAAALAVPADQECPECGGTGTNPDGEEQGGWMIYYPCDAEGCVDGRVPLPVPAVLLLVGEQVGWAREFGGGRPIFNAVWELGPKAGAVPVFRARPVGEAS